MTTDTARLLAEIKANILALNNGPLLDLRMALWSRGDMEPSLAVDDARHRLSAALHELRRVDQV